MPSFKSDPEIDALLEEEYSDAYDTSLTKANLVILSSRKAKLEGLREYKQLIDKFLAEIRLKSKLRFDKYEINEVNREESYAQIFKLLTEGLLLESPLFLNEPERAEAFTKKLLSYFPTDTTQIIETNWLLFNFETEWTPGIQKVFFLISNERITMLGFFGYD